MIDNTDLNELLMKAISSSKQSRENRRLPSLYACVEAHKFQDFWLSSGKDLNGLVLNTGEYDSYRMDTESDIYKW